jgi:hypothetical protein
MHAAFPWQCRPTPVRVETHGQHSRLSRRRARRAGTIRHSCPRTAPWSRNSPRIRSPIAPAVETPVWDGHDLRSDSARVAVEDSRHQMTGNTKRADPYTQNHGAVKDQALTYPLEENTPGHRNVSTLSFASPSSSKDSTGRSRSSVASCSSSLHRGQSMNSLAPFFDNKSIPQPASDMVHACEGLTVGGARRRTGRACGPRPFFASIGDAPPTGLAERRADYQSKASGAQPSPLVGRARVSVRSRSRLIAGEPPGDAGAHGARRDPIRTGRRRCCGRVVAQ